MVIVRAMTEALEKIIKLFCIETNTIAINSNLSNTLMGIMAIMVIGMITIE